MLTYEETEEIIDKIKTRLRARSVSILSHAISGGDSFYNGLFSGMLSMEFDMKKDSGMNQDYIRAHYENEESIVLARTYFLQTDDENIKFYLKMKWGDTNWL